MQLPIIPNVLLLLFEMEKKKMVMMITHIRDTHERIVSLGINLEPIAKFISQRMLLLFSWWWPDWRVRLHHTEKLLLFVLFFFSCETMCDWDKRDHREKRRNIIFSFIFGFIFPPVVVVVVVVLCNNNKERAAEDFSHRRFSPHWFF